MKTRAALFVVLLATVISGCFEKEENTCEYWAKKLTSAAKAERALQGVQELKCTNAWPTLEKMFDDGQFRDEIVRLTKQIGDKNGAAPLLRKALKSREQGKLASTIVADWKLEAAEPELMDILEGDVLPKHRAEALKALMSFRDPADVEDLLIKLAAEDPNEQGWQTNALAIEQLGNMRSKKAIPTLVKAAFVRTVRGEKLYRTARTALAKVGPATVPLLIKTIKGENEELIEYAKANGIHEWEWKSGPEIVQLLTDTLDQRVCKPVVDNLAAPLVEPTGVSPAVYRMWQIAQGNRLQVLTFGLGHVGVQDPAVIEELKKLCLEAEERNQRYRSMSVLAYTGTKDAQDAMMECFEKQEYSDVKAGMVEDITRGFDSEHFDYFRKKVLKKLEGAIGDKLKDEWNVAYISVIDECKDDAGCLIKKLDSENKHQVIKAATLLARGVGDPKLVRAALLRKFKTSGTDQIDVRRFTLMGLTRVGDNQTGEELVKLAAGPEKKTPFWKEELEAFGNYLAQRGKDGGDEPAAPEEKKEDEGK